MYVLFFSSLNRASVAGFTNISFTAENIIMEEYSYVSFSPCSDKVSLPQDPGIVNAGLAVLNIRCAWKFLN